MNLNVTLADQHQATVVQSVVRATTLYSANTDLLEIAAIDITDIWAVMLQKMASGAGYAIDDRLASEFLLSIANAITAHYHDPHLRRFILNSTGASIDAAAEISATLHGLLTLRLGLYLAEQFAKPVFSGSHWVPCATPVVPLLTAFATYSELQDVASLILHTA